MAQFLIPSGSRRISQLTSVNGISGSTAMPIVMGGNTVQVSHTDFLNSTVFNESNTFTELNTFTIEQRIINNGSTTDLTGDGIIIREDVVSGPPTYGFRISSSAEEILFQDIIPPSNGNIFDTFLEVKSNAGEIGILRNTSIDGNLIVSGGITTEIINVNVVSSSIVYSSGSNLFGNTLSNTHQFTGSLRVTGSANIIGGFTQTVGAVSFGGATTFNNSITTFNQGINVLNQASSFFVGVNIGTSPQTRNLTHFGNYIHTGNTIQTGSISVNGNITASSFTGSLSYTNLDNIPNVVSSSTQINQYNIFATTGSNEFVGNQSVNGDVIVTGSLIVSGSNTFRNIGRAEFTGSVNVNGGITVTQSITASIMSGSFVGDGTLLSGVSAADVEFADVLNKPTLVSGSSQVSFNGIVDKPTLVSGSSQIDLTQTTNYISGIKDRLNAETVVSSSQQVKTLLPNGTVSGSSQIQYSSISNIPNGIVSSSQQVITLLPNGTVSGSSQVSFNGIVDKPTLVSSSQQIQYGDISNIPNAIVSSSQQVLDYSLFALTASQNTFYGNQTIIGDTIITGSLIVSSSNTFKNIGKAEFSGSFETNTFLQLNPLIGTINSGVSGSYIYSSGSEGDIYLTQNHSGFANTVALRWIEGNLYTGLLYGGILSVTPGGTTFNLSSGSGIIVKLNATVNDEPYPTIKYIQWDNLTNQPIQFLTSSIQSFIGIDEDGEIYQQLDAFSNGDYNDYITIGTVLHQNQSTVNASISYPNVAYGYKQRTYDFVKAFGPLKISGLQLLTSSSLGLNVSAGTAYSDGRNYQTNPNSPSFIEDNGTSVSKIFRYYQSGSGFVQDTNAGVGYTQINPNQYNNNGVLTTLTGNNPNNNYWSIQRVFWYPNSATQAIVVYYGNQEYQTLNLAKVGLSNEVFGEIENTKQNAVYLGAIIIQKNGSFTNADTFEIISSGLFRNISGGGGAGGATILPTDITALNQFTSSIQSQVDIISSSYATTGSNTFVGNQIISGSVDVTGSLDVNSDVIIENGYVILTQVSQSLEFEDDTVAAIGNVPLGGLYRSGSFIKIRIS
jgi:hypothetical protein